MRLRVLIVLFLVSVSLAEAEGGIDVCFAPSAQKILRDADVGPRAETCELAAARNETEACQLVLRSRKDCRGATVFVSGFGRGVPAKLPQVALFTVAYVPNVLGDTPYPDPLPPLSSLDLKANEAQPVWISVRVPAGVRPGVYKTTVTVAYGAERLRRRLRVTVWDFALPETPNCATAFGIDEASIARQHDVQAGSAAAQALYAQYYEMLLDHRISAYTVPADLMSGEAARYLDDPRMTSYMIPFPASDDALKALVERLVVNGWYRKGYFYPIDEPFKKEAYAEFERICDRLRKLAPGYRLVTPFFRGPDWETSETAFDLMSGKINVWCPNEHYFDLEPKTRPYLDERRRLGESVWWYVCCGPGAPYCNFFVQMSAMSHRMLFWEQYREHVQGLLYWSTTYWNPSSTENPWTNMMTVKDINPDLRGDGSLMYPGKQVGLDGPVSSIRLEVIRDGIEDFDYLKLAEERFGPDAAAGYAARLVRSLTDYEQDPTALERVRRELGARLSEGGRERGL